MDQAKQLYYKQAEDMTDRSSHSKYVMPQKAQPVNILNTSNHSIESNKLTQGSQSEAVVQMLQGQGLNDF